MYEILFFMNIIRILENKTWLLDLSRIKKFLNIGFNSN